MREMDEEWNRCVPTGRASKFRRYALTMRVSTPGKPFSHQ